jgi:hypothetical protein
MSNFNWCHGPHCHTNSTQSRVRGSKGNKVLRTIKIKQDSNYRSYDRYKMFNYFCNQSCLMDYINTHIQSIVAIAPRREPLETPIKDPVKETNEYTHWSRWTIEKKVG